MEKAYQFRKELLEVHKKNIRNTARAKKEDEYVFENSAKIKIQKNSGIVIKTAALDFKEFLEKSMCIDANVVENGEKADITIELAKDCAVNLGEFSVYKGFKIVTHRDGVNIFANDERGAAQALYYIEDMMSFEKAPVVALGEIVKKPLFSPQMIHSLYGVDEYPDEYLARIAHEGRDAVVVFTKGANETPGGYLDFNDLIQRAEKYGIDVYAYSFMTSNMSPEAPEAEAFYEGTYGELFRKCPKLKGVVLVGESVEFPSKDPHVAKGRYFETATDGIPSDKPSSGWYPCFDYPIWLNLIKRIIRKYNPDADIVFWSYNWDNQPEEARVKLIESLPKDITLQATFETAHHISYGKSTGRCADYTLSFEGPGEYFISEAKAAARCGVKLYSMTNTGGRTWDFGVAPYEPMPYQWIKRYEALQNAHDLWGLCGIMECHHYGFYPSIISKLSKHSFMEPRENMQDILKKILVSEFGEENYDIVDSALQQMSEGIRYYTPSDADQYGAYRVGPAYPFNLSANTNIPAYEGAMYGNIICEPKYLNKSDWRMSPLSVRIGEELEFQNKMLGYFEKAVSILFFAENKNESLKKLLNLCCFLVNCVKTGINAKKWHMLICDMNCQKDKTKLASIYDNMEKLLEDEINNTQSTIELVEKDSLLGFEPSMLYMTDRWHLEWKIRQVRYVINTELNNYRRALSIEN